MKSASVSLLAILALNAFSLSASAHEPRRAISSHDLRLNNFRIEFPTHHIPQSSATPSVIMPALKMALTDRMNAQEIFDNYRAYVKFTFWNGPQLYFDGRKHKVKGSIRYDLTVHIPSSATAGEILRVVQRAAAVIPYKDEVVSPSRPLRPIRATTSWFEACTDWLNYHPPLELL